MEILKPLVICLISFLSICIPTTVAAYVDSSLLQKVGNTTEAVPNIDSDKPIADEEKWEKPNESSLGGGDKVRFNIFTSPGKMERVRMGNVGSLSRTRNFTLGKPIVLLVHGYIGSCSEDNFPGLLVDAYFEAGRSDNILCVDWPELAFYGNKVDMFEYWESMDNALVVAMELAEFIKFLLNTNVIQSLSDVHLIGYSVGGHIVGIAAALIQKDLKVKIGRATGLDPAFPLYNFRRLEERLDSLDANFVDVYHTNAGLLGFADRIGHSDFYINGGVTQPECTNTGNPKLDKAESLTGACSHQMVPQYYAKSIKNQGKVRACNATAWGNNHDNASCTEMVHFGEQSILGPFGEFYVFIGAKRLENIWIPDIDFSQLALRFMF